jgi:hypothetical protein
MMSFEEPGLILTNKHCSQTISKIVVDFRRGLHYTKHMIKFTTMMLLGLGLSCGASEIDKGYRDKIVSAIWKIEGGAKTKYPYGIKSINTGGDVAKAKRICENTVSDNWKRWEASGKTNEFVVFLGNRYCPPDAHALNKNWVGNLKKELAKK